MNFIVIYFQVLKPSVVNLGSICTALPTGQLVGSAFPTSGQYVSIGHSVHVSLLTAAVKLL
jgi:hypothetical protein